MFLQRRLNKSSCVLNNMESLIRTRRWRDPQNREEGAWLRTTINRRTGWHLSRARIDAIINTVIAAAVACCPRPAPPPAMSLLLTGLIEESLPLQDLLS